MSEIVRRDDVLNRLNVKRRAEIEEAVQKVNAALKATPTLPVRIPVLALGEDVVVRTTMMDRLKAAGWAVKNCDDDYGSDHKMLELS